jgi:leucyl aminopeptidase
MAWPRPARWSRSWSSDRGGEPILAAAVQVEVVQSDASKVDAGLVCIGLFEDEALPTPFAELPGAEDVKPGFRKLTLLRSEKPERVLVVGLGKRDELDRERMRVAGALAVGRAQGFEAETLAWELPAVEPRAELAGALVEGAVLAAYRFDRYRSEEDRDEAGDGVERLEVLSKKEPEIVAAVESARIASEAANRARDLQNLPANEVTPVYLAERAEEIAGAHDTVEVEVLGPEDAERLGMGGIVGVARGSVLEPRLIALRYSGAGKGAETVALVGKAVTFDSGGISIKPSASMHEMKMDMSGGAAVIEGLAAIAELGLAVNVLAVIPAVENMPAGDALRPGDVIVQHNGKTVEIINTDAEGRLILADALSWSVEQGADRIVDLATLTGAVLSALGSTYAGLISNDDDWAGQVEGAAENTGELAWRLPLHNDFKELTKGTITDLVNSSSKRKAGTIYAASFLEEFVDGKPWVHLDIAGTAWDVGRAYADKGATGYGVRLLVELCRELSTDG